MDNAELINSMIDKIVGGENTSAKEDFEALISAKVSNALEVKKQEVAQSIYSNEQPEESKEEEIVDEPEQV